MNNCPSWDAGSWLQRFAQFKDIWGGTRPLRAEVFQSTVNIAKCGKYLSSTGHVVALDEVWNPDALRDNVFYEREVSLKSDGRKYDTPIRVVNQDCLAFAHELHMHDATDDLCVLNMASNLNPGGGVHGGAGAQEEYLFRAFDEAEELINVARKRKMEKKN